MRRWGRRYSGPTLIEVLILIVILGICTSLAVFIVGGAGDDSSAPPNTNPRHGWVQLDRDHWKRCDGTTMLYRSDWDGSFTASPHHEECTG